jgi:very-short-patch-repair endonuclease
MDNVISLMRSLDGVATWATMRRGGITSQLRDRYLDGGMLQRVRRGVYAMHGADPAVRTAAAHGGALTCASLLRAEGVWVLNPGETTHVWLGKAGQVYDHTACTCVAHYSAGRAGPGKVSVAVALVHLYRCQGGEAFLCSYESAWNQQMLSATDREWIRTALPKSAHDLLDFAVPTAQSGIETLPRLRLRPYGFTVVSQFKAGIDQVDILVDDCVLVEADGEQNHASPSKRHKDLRRDARTSQLGYETLRFDYRQVVHDWPTVLAAILAAVERARGRR